MNAAFKRSQNQNVVLLFSLGHLQEENDPLVVLDLLSHTQSVDYLREAVHHCVDLSTAEPDLRNIKNGVSKL